MTLSEVRERAVQVIEEAHDQFSAGVLDDKRGRSGDAKANTEFYLSKFTELVRASSNEEQTLVNLLRVLRPGFKNGERSWARLGSVFNVTCTGGRIAGHVKSTDPEQILRDLETLRGKDAHFKKSNYRSLDEILNRMGEFAPRLPEERARLGRIADNVKNGKIFFESTSPSSSSTKPNKAPVGQEKVTPHKSFAEVASGEANELDSNLAQLRGFFVDSDNVMPEIVASLAELLRANQGAYKDFFQLVRNPFGLAGKLLGLRASESMYRMLESNFEHLERGDTTLKDAPPECVAMYVNMLSSTLAKVTAPKTLHSFSVPKAKPGSSVSATTVVSQFAAFAAQLAALEPGVLADVVANSIQTGSKLVPMLGAIHADLSQIMTVIPPK